MISIINARSFKSADEGVLIVGNQNNRTQTLIIPNELWGLFLAAIIELEPGNPKTVSISFERDEEDD